MTEQEAVELGLRLINRHIVPAEMLDERELTIIQLMGDLYKAGYCVSPRVRLVGLPGETLEQMKGDGVCY